MSPIDLLVAIFVGLLGLVFGSFLNVCIARLPKHESIAYPPSHCPRCGTPIRALDNIPLLSYLILRGRCRACHNGISWRYPAVELANAMLWLACLLQFGPTLHAVAMAFLCFLCLGLAVMDAETMLLPDTFTLPGILLGVLWSVIHAAGRAPEKLRAGGWSIIWAAAAAALILLIRGLYWLVRRREGLGLGDAKLLAMLAAWLGPQNAGLILFLAVLAATIYGIAVMMRPRVDGRHPIPLGSFLCAAALYAIFLGPQTIAWYLSFFS